MSIQVVTFAENDLSGKDAVVIQINGGPVTEYVLDVQFTGHVNNHNNPHQVTKAQVGLGSVDNTSDTGKPVSGPQQTALDGKANLADLNAHTARTDNPHATTRGQVGLGNVDNTSDLSKPISTSTQAALDSKASSSALAAHTGNINNPHATTKTQVGLGNVDNTADVDKPISTAVQGALGTKATSADLAAHVSNTNNPHATTKSQVGLGNADNTSDANKPISTATQAALDAKTSTNDPRLTDTRGWNLYSGSASAGQVPTWTGSSYQPRSPTAYVGPSAPASPPSTYLWFQTGLGSGGSGMTLWIEDGT